ncbi:uncharacterized protein MYCFIDRAFT_179088 [Pseudocercospora fijiensis CIRAD86]|uniref:Uncharacterized protein n=1 Tax=Pseudocercospora fijiensis (strain CIRAD86) TaxID=383855 RepID=M2ZEK7_PSEFD|nr:uncharacterized protein MYCFIDRAFT_179088 [Pseudocercospora fijiensis CIRAD86]EME77569.1 hypothetical protein MYCFIDRAFT_179088 [Pseudocercospora fijiensis CIRAD86]
MRQHALEYAPAGFHATGYGSGDQRQIHHQSQMQFQDPHLHTHDMHPNKRRKLDPESTQKTMIARALTRAEDTHRKSNATWPAVPPPDINLPQFVNPRDLMLHPVIPRPEFSWDNKFLFSSRDFEKNEVVPLRPLGSRQQPPPSNLQPIPNPPPRKNTNAPSKIVVLPGIIGIDPTTAIPSPSPQTIPALFSKSDDTAPPSQSRFLPATMPLPTRRDSGAQIPFDESKTRPIPRNRNPTQSITSNTSDSGSIYTDHSKTPPPPPESSNPKTPPSSPPPPPPNPQPKKKKNKNPTTTHNRRPPTSLPPHITFQPGTAPIPSEISTLVTHLKRLPRKNNNNNFPQRTALRKFSDFDSRYGVLKRSSILWKEWWEWE